MSGLIRILLLLVTLFISSCSLKEGEKHKGRIIPQKEMVTLMTELYISDGILAYPPARNLFSAKDSIANYIDVINKHGYTKEQMDMTLKYYFIDNPKKLQKIYDEVLAKLSAMQSELQTITPVQTGLNLWNQKDRMSVPEDGAHNLLFFSIPVKDTGMYELSFTAIIYNDDQSKNPRTSTWFWHSSETNDGVKDNWDNIDLIKDGIRHTYSVRKRLTDTTFTHISGWLFKCDDQSVNWIKHGTFSSISLVRIPYTPE